MIDGHKKAYLSCSLLYCSEVAKVGFELAVSLAGKKRLIFYCLTRAPSSGSSAEGLVCLAVFRRVVHEQSR